MKTEGELMSFPWVSACHVYPSFWTLKAGSQKRGRRTSQFRCHVNWQIQLLDFLEPIYWVLFKNINGQWYMQAHLISSTLKFRGLHLKLWLNEDKPCVTRWTFKKRNFSFKCTFFISVLVWHSQTKISKAELQTYKKCSYHLGTKTAIRVLVQMIPL